MPTFGVKYFIFLAITIGFSLCDEKKIITNITTTQVRGVGESVNLNCTVDNPEEYFVLWSKKSRERPSDPVLLSIKDQLTVKDSRFKLNVDKNKQVYSLQINNIEFGDTAIYECQVLVSTTLKETSHVELLIRHPPKIVENIEITPSPVPVGNSAQLKCIADGYPRPSISWIRDYDAILPAGGHSFNGNVLKITEVTKEDRGLYYCIADNMVGKPDRRSINFEVEFAPSISVPRPKVAQALDYDIELECKVEAYPAPSVVWYKNGVQINNDGDYSISTTATINEITTSILHIVTVEKEQYGDYVCKASNKVGVAEERINLFGKEQLYPNINFSGLQWSASASIYRHFHFILNYIIIVILTILFL